MGLHTWTLAMAVGAATLVVGCTQGGTVGSNGADAGGASDSPSTGTTDGAKALSCTEVLQCAGNCPDADADACVQSCVERTSAGSQSVTTALVQCISDNACADADCINAKCGAELDACLADTPAEGSPATDPPEAGSVPADLVGTWSSVGTSSGTVWTFEADGKTTTAFELDTSMGSCTNKTSVTSSGVTTAAADTFVYHRSSGTQVFDQCGSASSSALGAAELTYRYELGAYDDGDPKLTIYFVEDDGSVNSSGTELHH